MSKVRTDHLPTSLDDVKRCKALIMDEHSRDLPTVLGSLSGVKNKEDKTKAIHDHLACVQKRLLEGCGAVQGPMRVLGAILVKYCGIVVGLETRNSLWKYDQLSFSRRIGEHWERICETAWDHAVAKDVHRIDAPTVDAVIADKIIAINDLVADHANLDRVISIVNDLCEPLRRINMESDVVFMKDNVPGVVDFKLGFNSNERGNMDRLANVAWAYRAWNPETQLLMLVRKTVNNKYLQKLNEVGGWQVFTGLSAYRKVTEITGVDIEAACRAVIDWEGDLGRGFWDYLQDHPKDLTGYLEWTEELEAESL